MWQHTIRTLGVVALLAACAVTSGTRFSEDDLAALRIGTSTYDEVVSALGEPTNVLTKDGKTFASYGYASAPLTPTYRATEDGIEDVVETYTEAITLTFDEAGVLQDKKRTAAIMRCKAGRTGACKKGAPMEIEEVAPRSAS